MGNTNPTARTLPSVISILNKMPIDVTVSGEPTEGAVRLSSYLTEVVATDLGLRVTYYYDTTKEHLENSNHYTWSRFPSCADGEVNVAQSRANKLRRFLTAPMQ